MAGVYGGIEGGTTGSRIILIDEKGNRLGFAEGPHTNQWFLGIPETVRRLLELLDDALEDAKLPRGTKIGHLGMTLSGVDTVETERELTAAILETRPEIAESIRVCSDTLGTLLTVTDGPAIVPILGTGSVCMYIRKDLSYLRVGGYNYRLGDGASAYYISRVLISKFLKIEDGLMLWDYDIEKVRKLIYDFFKIERSSGLWGPFYANFDKTSIAKLCEHIAKAAHEGEPLCREAFRIAGVQLGRHVRSCLRQLVIEKGSTIEEVPVVCCGKVFLSWDLLRPGFFQVINDSSRFFRWKGVLNMVWLKVTAGYGAAKLAARLGANIDIPFAKDTTKTLERVEICTI